MALTGLQMLIANTDGIGFKLIPHIEHLALKYVFRNYAMAARVHTFTDMSGWNARKISEYLPARRAGELSEDTAIPDNTMVRVRKATLEPKEVGERYRVSDRRTSTDIEDITADIVESLGKSIGDKLEQDLQDAARDEFIGGTIGDGTAVYTLNLMLQAATLFRQRARHGQLFHVIHPFQALEVMEDLIDYAGAQTSLPFRDSATTQLAGVQSLTEFDLPTFGGVNLVVGDYLPRRVVFGLAIYGTAGTFRLQLGDGYDTATPFNITAAITVSTTPATLLTNIQAGLDGLDMSLYYSGAGSWVVTGTDILLMTITPPSDFYIDDGSNLRVAVQYDDVDKASLWGGANEVYLQKSGYDLITTITGSPQDVDGNDLGVTMSEQNATARSLLFQRSAIVLDIRKPIVAHFDNNINQGRTFEYAGSTVYGIGRWSPELGMFVHTKASSPLATAP